MSAAFSIHGVFPNYHDGTRVSYIFKSILEAMGSADVAVHGYVLGRIGATDADIRSLLPMRLYRFTSRLVANPSRAIVGRFGHLMKAGDVAYFWLENPPELTRELQRRGIVVVREMINCTAQRCHDEMARAYDALGDHGRVASAGDGIERERAELLAADAVFCPNDLVLESVRACGVPASRCLRTSYGWSEERLRGTSRLVPEGAGTNFLFAGAGNVRKGFPWLLMAWERANVPGKLLIAGHIDAELRSRYAHLLARDDVVDLGYVSDIGAAYRSCDVFCFPSWEEGGPMVTIEAIGMGLPCIVTPMGGAGILSGTSGGAVIVAPGDVDAIAGAIRRLAADPALRARLGSESKRLAADYTWGKVGRRRREAIEDVRIDGGRGCTSGPARSDSVRG